MKNVHEQVILANMVAYDKKGVDRYIDGAPHIKHHQLRRLYARLLGEVVGGFGPRNDRPLRVLDLGAGEGEVTLPMLKLGAHVTAVDISIEQLTILEVKCAEHRDRLNIRVQDIMEFLREDQREYDIITANSLLHHIPDYLELLKAAEVRLCRQGRFFSFQDPLFYPAQPFLGRSFDKLAYFLWRVTRGDVWAGLKRHRRRARGVYLPDSPHDNAEYHILRNGVNQNAIMAFFQETGHDCRVIPYYSTQSGLFQWLGESLGMTNTFALITSGRAKVQ